VRRGLVQTEVDPAAARLPDRKLREGCPARMERREEDLEHRRLVPIPERRTRVGVDAGVEIRPERRGESLVRLDGWPLRAAFDARQEAEVDPGRAGQLRSRHASILAKTQQIAGQRCVTLGRGSGDGLLEL